jgi:hypothetical protein
MIFKFPFYKKGKISIENSHQVGRKLKLSGLPGDGTKKMGAIPMNNIEIRIASKLPK